MITGTVKWFNEKKGYGFITGDDNNDIFVHYSDIVVTGYRKLVEGQKVEYEVTEHNGRNKAISVAILD
ncbi:MULTISPECIES: cold-shock protein [unclassified Enterococcus]|uniref:cold shock domain-containing protein n=1 Tax=unclassified Enterococcus TaxID=2608891 RepID=UPI001555EDD6|nr:MULTISPECIES: cold-shock protein [unclassified Enterococcus]MBS7576843.1 cold-shock protein [Enterococcus sp. MMGLQ5-2]MBS7584250.1 cold-shock protein [Enterococcus sp. MMGLQ5-1]